MMRGVSFEPLVQPSDYFPEPSLRPDTAPQDRNNFGLTESNTSSIGRFKSKAHLPGLAPKQRTPASQLGMPYFEEQRVLVRRNRALEHALRRMGEELTRYRDTEQEQHDEAGRALEALQREHEEAMARKEAELGRARDEAEEQLEESRAAWLREAEAERRAALDRQLIELTGDEDEKRVLREQQEKEERIELLRRQVGRRLLHQAITRGWTAWYEMWAARASAMQRLSSVAKRLRGGCAGTGTLPIYKHARLVSAALTHLGPPTA